MKAEITTKKSAIGFFTATTFLVLVLAGCGGGGGGTTTVVNGVPNYTVGGTVSGLAGSVVLQDNGGDNLTVSANGANAFATKVASGSPYNVTILSQPLGQTCSVSNGSGTISGNVTNVAVSCANNPYTIGGSVTGLAGFLMLQNNGGDSLIIAANGNIAVNSNFTFAKSIPNGSTYNVIILTQPTGQTCSVSMGTGAVSGHNVSNVAVVCATNTYSVGGTISGLTGTLVLQDNNGDNLAVSASGGFTFATKVANGSPYSVTVLTHPTGQSCSVASGTGTISLANITNVAITCSTNTYTIGGTVTGLSGTMVLQNNGGDNLTVTVNGSFSFATTVAYGNSFNVAVLTQPAGQICTVTGGSGAVAGNITTVTANCMNATIPRYAFTANFGDNSVSTYVVNASNGRLKYIGKVASIAGPESIAVDPSGKYAYVANNISASVSQYTIGTDGVLSPMIQATVAAEMSPVYITVDSSGRYAYVANWFSSTISQYTIGSGGALTPMTPATVVDGAGNAPMSITIDPSGKHAYVANQSGSVSQYTIGAGGALTPMAPATVAAGISSVSVTIDPSGRYAYVADVGNIISQYTIGAGGTLTPMSPAAVVIPSGPVSTSVTVDPYGKYVYVGNGNVVAQFTIGAGGGLMPMTPSWVGSGATVQSITVDPSGMYAYAVNFGSSSVSQYAIGANGALTPMAPATVVDAAKPYSIVVAAGAAPAQAVPKYAYVANTASNSISQYSVGANGALTLITSVAAGPGPVYVAVDPSAKYAYVVNSNDSISQYTIGANGALTLIATVAEAPGSIPRSVTVDPSGRYAYVANFFSASVSQYTIGANGGLTPMATATVAAGTNPYSVTVDPSGRYAYAANNGSNDISQYSIGANGALTPMLRRLQQPERSQGSLPSIPPASMPTLRTATAMMSRNTPLVRTAH